MWKGLGGNAWKICRMLSRADVEVMKTEENDIEGWR